MFKLYTQSFLLFNIIISLILIFNNAFFINIFKLPISIPLVILIISYYICALISFLVVNYLLYLVCWRKQKIFKSIIFILLLSSFIIGYYSLKYQVNIDDNLIIGINHEFSLVGTVVSWQDVLIIAFFTILLIYYLLKVEIVSSLKVKPSLIIGGCGLAIFILAYQGFKYEFRVFYNSYRGWNQGLRQEITHNLNYYKYFYIIKDLIKFYQNVPSQTEIRHSIKKGDVVLNKQVSNVTVMFLMSDTVRAKSMSLFNYKLETNPHLQELYKHQQFFLLKQKVCYRSTFISLNCMMSLTNAKKFKQLPSSAYAQEKITKYFNYLGVVTYYLYNNDVSFFANGYKYIPYSMNTAHLDSALLPTLYKVINSNRQFITVNLRGAHMPYGFMLEKRFRKFHSNYDNKILQTDYIWSEIIKNFNQQNTPIFAILTADHGESLGEVHNGKKYYFHGNNVLDGQEPKEQNQVPLIVFVNKAYKRLYPNYVKNIENNVKKYKISGKLLSSDAISHSLLNCAGIEGKVIDKSLSICAKQFR
ncbi:ALP like super family protein [Candidatus Hepatincola sp. Pdp]